MPLPKIHIDFKNSKRYGDCFELRIKPEFDPELDTILRNLPQKYWQFGSWLAPSVEENTVYIAEEITKDPDSFELTPEAKVLLEYELLKRKQVDEKVKKRAEFVFDQEAPPIPPLPNGEEYPFVFQPYKHQQVALHSCLFEEAFALLMEMGTGKTFICVNRAAYELCHRAGSVEEAKKELTDPSQMYKVLILAPKSLLGVWQREFEKFSPVPFDFAKLVGSKSDRVDAMIGCVQGPHKLKVIAINYESVVKFEDILKIFRFDLCIADESSRIKTPSAKRTKAALAVAASSKQRMILTGTPVTNSVIDLFSQFEFIQRGALGVSSKRAFESLFAERDFYTKKVHVKNAVLLRRRMARYSFIVKKKDCLDLPNKIYETREVFLDRDQKTAYNTMREMLIAELTASLDDQITGAHETIIHDPYNLAPPSLKRVTAKIILVKYLRLMQITSGFLKTDEGDLVEFPNNPKLKETISIIESLPEDQKVIVWGRFTHDLEIIERELVERGINCVRYDGSTNSDMSDVALKEFEHNDLCRVFIGNQAKGGVGLTLLGSETCPVTTVIYFSNDFSLEKRLQSEDRCHRVGLKNPITYIDIIVPGSIDEYVLGALRRKTNLLEAFTDAREMALSILGEELK